ncbi:hypothetical protein [Rhizobium cauense]|nr:hypothetical protein [Rhizobium cauense]
MGFVVSLLSVDLTVFAVASIWQAGGFCPGPRGAAEAIACRQEN